LEFLQEAKDETLEVSSAVEPLQYEFEVELQRSLTPDEITLPSLI
jgi:hypothetical protein